jgi:hypothetical protein
MSSAGGRPLPSATRRANGGRGVGRVMKISTRLAVGAALCAAVPFTSINCIASPVIEITGNSFILGFPGYGSTVTKNNVINYDPSGIVDKKGGIAWHMNGAVISKVDNYAIDWYFSGAESGDRIVFSSGSITPFAENNQNDNLNHNHDGFKPIGTSIGSGKDIPISFTLLDSTRGTSVSNGGPLSMTSLMFAYLEPEYEYKYGKKILEGWKVTKNKSNWFAFGFNDGGSSDHDFDDYVGVGYAYAIGSPVAQTPLPGALPLMGSALGVGSLLGAWGRRRLQRIAGN